MYLASKNKNDKQPRLDNPVLVAEPTRQQKMTIWACVLQIVGCVCICPFCVGKVHPKDEFCAVQLFLKQSLNWLHKMRPSESKQKCAYEPKS